MRSLRAEILTVSINISFCKTQNYFLAQGRKHIETTKSSYCVALFLYGISTYLTDI